MFHWGTARGWDTGPGLLPRCEPGLVEVVDEGPDPENKSNVHETKQILFNLLEDEATTFLLLPTAGFYIIMAVNRCKHM